MYIEVFFTAFSLKQENIIGRRFLKFRTTHIAWDNFDINIKPLSGENTIHHTYRICCQNISPFSSESIMYNNSSINSGNINL